MRLAATALLLASFAAHAEYGDGITGTFVGEVSDGGAACTVIIEGAGNERLLVTVGGRTSVFSTHTDHRTYSPSANMQTLSGPDGRLMMGYSDVPGIDWDIIVAHRGARNISICQNLVRQAD